MTSRLAISHLSSYRYNEPVVASYNEVRMTPTTNDRQTLLSNDLAVSPAAPLYRYVDYWSTAVHAFDVHESHTELTITATSLVETSEPTTPDASVSWADVRDPLIQDAFAELLASTVYSPLEPELGDVAVEVAGGSSPLEAVMATTEWVRQTLAYERGATAVSTSAIEAWRRRAGVCQDFAHLTLVLLRHLGIPARYVSGYVHPEQSAPTGVTVAGTSHAWIEAWLGDWHPLDPTSGTPVGDLHVTVGRGRDYRDVAPLLGVYHGGSLEELVVDVGLTRVA
jgi:transglutaminase-like putative cysteine protease